MEMAKDAELDRLKVEQDAAFQRKQDAYQAQQRAWERRSAARDSMNRAYEAKQSAYEEQNRTWHHFRSVRDSNSPRVDSLNAQQEQAFENMKRSYDAASSAYDRRDGASASSYAAEGRRYKEESQRYVAERRRLVEEIRRARAQHEVSRSAFLQAKDEFSAAKGVFDLAKAEHERIQTEFKCAKAEFNRAADAFRSRLEKVKTENEKRHKDVEAILDKAGIPLRYRGSVRISKGHGGSTNIYFGGIGKPDGEGHGHYVLDKLGTVTYRRDPYREHGSHNFTDNGRGGTLYDRSARPGFTPNRVSSRDNETKSRDGVFYDRNRPIDLHITQVYEDNVRVSWDTDGVDDRDKHLTNQNIRKRSPKRHDSPDK